MRLDSIIEIPVWLWWRKFEWPRLTIPEIRNPPDTPALELRKSHFDSGLGFIFNCGSKWRGRNHFFPSIMLLFFCLRDVVLKSFGSSLAQPHQSSPSRANLRVLHFPTRTQWFSGKLPARPWASSSSWHYVYTRLRLRLHMETDSRNSGVALR